MSSRNLVWLVAVPAFVLVGLAIGYSAPAPDKDYKLVRQIVDVLAEVDANYVRELTDDDRQKLVEDMIDGGLHQLDPHSEYLNAARLAEFETASGGSFGGVGITLGVDAKTKLLKVEYPMPGTPAYNAGAVAGDLIVKVEDASTEGMKIDEARKRITGPVNTPVTLTLRREGKGEFPVTLARAQIEMHPVTGAARQKADPLKWEWFIDPQAKIALVRIATFSELTSKELRAAVAEIEAAGGRGLVLDLRDNPGGLLNQAVEVADLFIPEGRIVSTKDRRGNERAFNAKRDGTVFLPTPDNPRPVAVLVNRNSASASEIVAAALQDSGRAVVVGERSFGKGSVQKLLRLPHTDPPAAVKLTTESYWRPSGKNIHRYPDAKEADDWGVRPNAGMEVPTTEDERIRYMVEMRRLEFVAGRPDAVGPNPPTAPTPRGADGKPLVDDSKPFEDRVLNKAVEEIRAKLR
ncbi:MAG TPA: S41 family peptidase [Urbifossiella sp.]|jgi:carboxyl-terminal processing protease|nr:S41 family peptidase [Urbifossiella sp.]